MTNSAHEVFKAIGGTCHIMINAKYVKRTSNRGGLYVPGAEPKITRNYRRRYQHILSDYLAEKVLAKKANEKHHESTSNGT